MADKLLLVTGGTGFVGSHLLQQLVAQGYRVRALRRANSRMDLVQPFADKVEWVLGDVNDLGALEDALQDVTHVFHCAAMVSFHPKDVAQMRHINIEGTANIVNLCLEMGIQQLIHVSSIAAIGRTKERPQLDESAKWVQSAGNSQYAISKYQSEQEVWRGWAEGLRVAIVNPAIILGPGRWDEGSGRFFHQVDHGLKFAPIGRSGFVDVRDVARFMLLLMQHEVNGERYILNAENLDFKQFFDRVAAALNKKPPFIAVTPFLAEVAWRVEWLKEKLTGAAPIVTKESARSSVSSYFYDNTKSKAAFGGFVYRPLSETITETVQAYRQPA